MGMIGSVPGSPVHAPVIFELYRNEQMGNARSCPRKQAALGFLMVIRLPTL